MAIWDLANRWPETWLGLENRKKLAKLSMTTFSYRSLSYLCYGTDGTINKTYNITYQIYSLLIDLQYYNRLQKDSITIGYKRKDINTWMKNAMGLISFSFFMQEGIEQFRLFLTESICYIPLDFKKIL